MKKFIIICLNVAAIFICGTTMAADAPHQIAVFALNEKISKFENYLIMETALPIRYMENIQEVEIKPIKGIKSGLIAYATCAVPEKIVRIKLKYSDSTKDFYEELLKRTKQKYGPPTDYMGDPFHIVISWKWEFVNENNERITMTLQHNTMDTEEKQGNSIKLTNRSLINEDLKCYRTKALDQRQKLRHREWKVKTPGLSGWDLYVPR